VQEDLDLFFQNVPHWDINNGTSPLPAFLDGCSDPRTPGDAGGESDLDFEIAYPIIYPRTSLYLKLMTFSTPGSIENVGGFHNLLDGIAGVRLFLGV
jgi:tripeptidyl-peptidase-1